MKLLLIFLFSCLSVFAGQDFVLEDVQVECQKSLTCSQRTSRFKTLVGEYRSILHLKDTLKIMASDGGYQTFTYSLEKENDRHILKIKFKMKPVIEEINIGFTDRNIEENPSQLVNIREGEFFETQKLKESMDGLQKRLDSLGFPNNTHSYEVIDKNGKVVINIVVTLGEPRLFKSINTSTKSEFVRDFLQRKFLNLYNKPFDVNKFKMNLDEAQKELFSYGYYLINMDFTPVYKDQRVNLNIKVSDDEIYAFDFKHLEREHRDVIHELVVDQFRKYKRPLTEAALSTAIRQHYRNKSLLNAKVRIERDHYKNKTNETVNVYRIFFDENGKTRLDEVIFNGNSYFKTSKIRKMFDKEAFELASINYYDEEYFVYFQEFLRNKYIEKGFVQVKVFDPVYTFDAQKKYSKVEYNIQEGPRAYIRDIIFTGLPENMETKVLSKMENKIGKPFNPIRMVEDIKAVANTLQDEGYYYAEVINANDNDVVRYNKAGTEVVVHLKIDSGPIVRLNRILYLGNDVTKKKVLAKKIPLKKGDLITPAKTRDFESAISATGLFNSVSVTPVKHNSKNTATDLLVRVSERDYKLLEVAPGYRTDLGLKLTGTVTFQNIGGYNRTVSLRSQVNRRTSFTTIDPERRDRIDHILEHNTSFSYTEGDIFDSLVDGAFTAAYQTRRFYAFDANILRSNITLTRDLTKRVSTSLRYQYEDISQYNATEEINNGSFRIGSITPSITYDLRNSQINPTKGAFFNLSSEFANPYFLSQKEPNLTINYYRLISRNRFYIPFKNGTFAISLVGGVQENLAKNRVTVNGEQQTEGYIPTIKVFRLSGMDIIRGFTDEEMNRLPDGRDISDVRVSDKAYMTTIKLEPRYFINDTLMLGAFYDAGRVFVDKMDFGDLRDSVGITFKIVTPVGTLDFDYGIKLLRKKDPSGRLEDPGRFHVSIGFF